MVLVVSSCSSDPATQDHDRPVYAFDNERLLDDYISGLFPEAIYRTGQEHFNSASTFSEPMRTDEIEPEYADLTDAVVRDLLWSGPHTTTPEFIALKRSIDEAFSSATLECARKTVADIEPETLFAISPEDSGAADGGMYAELARSVGLDADGLLDLRHDCSSETIDESNPRSKALRAMVADLRTLQEQVLREWAETYSELEY